MRFQYDGFDYRLPVSGASLIEHDNGICYVLSPTKGWLRLIIRYDGDLDRWFITGEPVEARPKDSIVANTIGCVGSDLERAERTYSNLEYKSLGLVI